MPDPFVETVGIAGPKLDPDRDLAISSCERDAPGRVVGLRWAARRELGFPPSGFVVDVSAKRGSPRVIGTFHLPDTSSWDTFAADAATRRPAVGPWFPGVAQRDLGFLLPLVRLVDSRVSASERIAQITAAADFFGHIHRNDPELKWRLRRQPFPPLAQMLGDDTQAAAVIGFYHQHTLDFLHVLALRFEYAALLGLGTDHQPDAGTLVYGVEARWPAYSGRSTADPLPDGRRCSPVPPAWLRVDRAPGTVPHPAFARWPNWSPPPELVSQEASGAPRPASTIVPQVPAAFSALTWADKAPESRLLGYGPVLYRVTRFHHGADTAETLTTPAAPSDSVFAAINEGELVARASTEPHLLDRPGMPWPPLEGHYHYAVHGIDLFGTVSSSAARSAVRHHDDIAPMAPRARAMVDGAIALAAGCTTAQLPLRVDWDPLEDFNSPDVVEFRVAYQWIPSIAVPVHVDSVVDISALHCDLTVSSLPAPANALAGLRLSIPGSDYPIESHTAGAAATIRIRKIGNRMPAAGVDGFVLSAGAPTPRRRVAKLARRRCAPATVAAVSSMRPLVVSLAAAGDVALPTDRVVRVYLHLLRITVDASFDDRTSRWTLTPPQAQTPASASWDRWTALSNSRDLLADSPVIVYPPHKTNISVPIPAGYSSGLLSLTVTAADSAAYVESPVLPGANASLANLRGNESGATELVVSVRTTTPPAAPVVEEWDPNSRLWARSATVYVEDASYDLAWQSDGGALRYEVWRALEGGLSGADGATSDADLRVLAERQADAFTLRSDQVFAPLFTDLIPGRAPTRALYRIRSVGLNGERSAPSDVIGPIYIPDVRQPPPPNLVRAVAVPPEEGDRTIAVEWTQGGDIADVRFDVYHRLASDASAPFALAGSVPRNSRAGPGGAFRFLHRDRPPGKAFGYQVVAVREAPDPIDPTATLRRDIASSPSTPRVGTAISSAPLAPPASLAATFDAAAGRVGLTWSPRDFYDRIEVRRKAPGRHGFELVAIIGGEAISFDEPAPPAGAYSYQLRAFGASRQATSVADVEVVIS